MSEISAALKACTTDNKRPRIHNAQMVTKCPQALKTLVNDYAKGRDQSEADIVRLALAEFFERRGYGQQG